MATNLYSIASVYINGALLAEETTVGIDRDSKAQEQYTVAKGFAGLSPGSPVTMISLDNAVPSQDFEVNPGQFIKQLQVVEVTVFAAGRTLTSKGFITSDNFGHAVNAEAKISMKFIGEYADWV